MRQLLTAATVLLLCSCSQKYLVMEAQVVSMTRDDAGQASELAIGEDIEERWCVDSDTPMSSSDQQIGLADQVIYKAQDGGRRADFITNVRIYRDGAECATLTGKLARAK